MKVLSSYLFVPELEAALLTEIDFAESNANLVRILYITLLIMFVTIILALLIGFVISLNISRPITSLTSVALDLANGDFSKRSDLKNNTEVGILAQSFNTMAGQVQDLVGSLESRVQERTSDLAT